MCDWLLCRDSQNLMVVSVDTPILSFWKEETLFAPHSTTKTGLWNLTKFYRRLSNRLSTSPGMHTLWQYWWVLEPKGQRLHEESLHRVRISSHPHEAAGISTWYKLGPNALWTRVQCLSGLLLACQTSSRSVLFLPGMYSHHCELIKTHKATYITHPKLRLSSL